MYNKTVILTFDDAVSNHCTFVAPLLKELGFNATFFVCEFPPDFATDKVQYMSWEQIEELDNMGFEVANHTLTHADWAISRPRSLKNSCWIWRPCSGATAFRSRKILPILADLAPLMRRRFYRNTDSKLPGPSALPRGMSSWTTAGWFRQSLYTARMIQR